MLWTNVYQHQKKHGKSFFLNYAVIIATVYVSSVVVVALCYSLKTAAFYLVSGLMVHILSHSLNYVQHYGIVRKQLPNGEYEKVKKCHSWDTPHRFCNYLLLKVERHADHHENSSKSYQFLSTSEEAFELPNGALLVVMMAAVYPVWFDTMSPLSEAY